MRCESALLYSFALLLIDKAGVIMLGLIELQNGIQQLSNALYLFTTLGLHLQTWKAIRYASVSYR